MRAEDTPFERLGDEYQQQVHGLVERFCLECHSTKAKEGELDLQRFLTLADVRRSPRAWQKVAEMLDNGEMPPKDAPQLSPDQRRQLRQWVERYLHAEARATAGDPGRVVLRRLNNVEYTNTVRDLTGVPLSPANELPTDGAAGEGFTNAAEWRPRAHSFIAIHPHHAGANLRGHAVGALQTVGPQTAAQAVDDGGYLPGATDPTRGA